MANSVLVMIASAATVIWIFQSQELMKPANKQNGRKIVTLTAAGSLLTLILTISLFQSIPF